MRLVGNRPQSVAEPVKCCNLPVFLQKIIVLEYLATVVEMQALNLIAPQNKCLKYHSSRQSLQFLYNFLNLWTGFMDLAVVLYRIVCE